jgi:hypothetical protein
MEINRLSLPNRQMPSLSDIMPRNEVVSFRERVSNYFSRAGLTLDRIASRHGQLLNSDDETVSLNAVKLAYQLHGLNENESQLGSGDVNIQVNIVAVNHTNAPAAPPTTP